jgi:hypothetical protein
MQSKEPIGKDATSKETLEDVEENEKSSTDKSDDDDLLSPDGTFDNSGELKDADPM